MTTNLSLRRLIVIALCLASPLATSVAQDPPKDDVIRINTELVQTAVTVTDKKGQFVDGLRPDQFVLKVDGKPQTIRFVERVTSGSAREHSLTAGDLSADPAGSSKTTYRGRTVIFFVDDLHLSLQSLDRTRQAILHFIDEEMGSEDSVAIASASGQVGFLQQFTRNREVLKAAVTRLVFRPYLARPMGMGGAPMSEYIAYVIDSRSDPKVTEVYIEECMKQTSVPKKIRSALQAIRMTCETQVKSNARSILLQSAAIAQDTYNSLDSLLQTSARLPGRKLTFFFSDGFLLDAGPRGGDLMQKLQQVIDRAQRAGVVVYTVDAKGLITTSLDATNNRVVDFNGRLESAAMREISATQDALHALADETGGRALRNQNVFDRFVGGVLKETSNYYLLAWRPETEEQKERKFHRVTIEIIGRPDLNARLPRGFFQGGKLEIAKTVGTVQAEPTIAKSTDVELRDALVDAHSTNSLPTVLALNYLNTPANGMVVIAATQIQGQVLNYGNDRKQTAIVDLAGVILNDKGKVATSFKKRLNIDPPAPGVSSDSSAVIYNHRAPLTAGIYQVRVAAREVNTRRIGSARDWIVVPDLQRQQLAVSSLLIGGQVLESATSQASNKQEPAQVQLSVDRRFPRSTNLGFWLFIYNAARDASNGGKPNLTVQVQVLREGKPLVTPPPTKVAIDGTSDLERIPYGGGLPLKSLTAGRYELRVTVNDLLASKSASLSSDFEVE
ncbi:MAG TPA: VWA domain-containing protein [Pyrinomonadaceae bacterium]